VQRRVLAHIGAADLPPDAGVVRFASPINLNEGAADRAFDSSQAYPASRAQDSPPVVSIIAGVRSRVTGSVINDLTYVTHSILRLMTGGGTRAIRSGAMPATRPLHPPRDRRNRGFGWIFPLTCGPQRRAPDALIASGIYRNAHPAPPQGVQSAPPTFTSIISSRNSIACSCRSRCRSIRS
jgi:hypothetical protein